MHLIYVCLHRSCSLRYYFLYDTTTNEIYTLSLHDALPISTGAPAARVRRMISDLDIYRAANLLIDRHGSDAVMEAARFRSEEHTSELQSLRHLVCRLLLEKKKRNIQHHVVPGASSLRAVRV